MIDFMLSCIIISCEILCYLMFMRIFLSEKSKGVVVNNIVLFIILLIGDIIVSTALINIFALKQFLIVVVNSLIMYVDNKKNFTKYLIVTIEYQGLLLINDYLIILLICKIFPSISQYVYQDVSVTTMVAVICRINICIIIFLLDRIFKDKEKDLLTNIEWMLFLIFPIFTISTVIAIVVNWNLVSAGRQKKILLFIAVGLLVVNISIFGLLNMIITKGMQLRKEKLFKERIRGELLIYENQKKISHEYKNKLECISGLFYNKNYEELGQYLQKLQFEMSDNLVDTNNQIVNAIINNKIAECKKKNILLTIKVDNLAYINIIDDDIVIIISNLLNNAIEASEQCINKRIIFLKFIQDQSDIIISVCNSSDHKVLMDDGKYKTTKIMDRNLHGYGIPNIIDVIQKYNGDYVIKNENGFFEFTIVIPNT